MAFLFSELKVREDIRTTGRIPESSEFFKDHFPEFPVLPGVLALEILKEAAVSYLIESEDSHHGDDNNNVFCLKKVFAVKFLQFFRPGDPWEAQLRLERAEGADTFWNGKLLRDGKVAVQAKWILRRASN